MVRCDLAFLAAMPTALPAGRQLLVERIKSSHGGALYTNQVAVARVPCVDGTAYRYANAVERVITVLHRRRHDCRYLRLRRDLTASSSTLPVGHDSSMSSIGLTYPPVAPSLICVLQLFLTVNFRRGLPSSTRVACSAFETRESEAVQDDTRRGRHGMR